MNNATTLAPGEWFAGANSRYGFVGLFDQIFSPEKLDRIYIIQGGPGTGKSRMMKEIGQAAQNGDISVEWFYCSSDPTSLDGVVLRGCKGSIGILDGTHPHGRLMSLPGVVEDMVYLGTCWSSDKLSKSKENILAENKAKKNAYQKGYARLALAGALLEERKRQMALAFSTEKAKKACLRLLKGIPLDAGQEELRYTDAYSMTGHAHLDTVSRKYSKIIQVQDMLGSADLFFSVLLHILQEKKAAFLRIPSVLDPDGTEAICFENSGYAFLRCKREIPYTAVVNSGRFVSAPTWKRERHEWRSLTTEANHNIENAMIAFSEAGVHHFALEQIYMTAMDFSKKEAITERLKEIICRALR